jgi:hypothetical protein
LHISNLNADLLACLAEDQFISNISLTSSQVRRNWICLYRLTTIVAIGLQKPYARLESGKNLVMYDVY